MLHNLLVSYSVKRFTTPSIITGVSASSQIVLGNMPCFGWLSLTKCLLRSLWIVSICISMHFSIAYWNTFILSDAETFRLTSSNVARSGRSMSVSQRPAVAPLMKPSVSFQMPMDVDTMMTESSCRSNAYGPPQHPVPQHQQVPYVCCSVSQGKAEIKAMLRNFQEDLNRVMASNFNESQLSTSSRPISQVEVGPTSSPPPFLCSLCIQRRQGTWYSCDNCHVVVVCIII